MSQHTLKDDPLYAAINLINNQRYRQYQQLKSDFKLQSCPIPDEFLHKIVPLSEDYFYDIMSDHPGYEISERRSSYESSLSIIKICFNDLFQAITDLETLLVDVRTHSTEADNDAIERKECRVRKELFAAANASASLVDHSRRLEKRGNFKNFRTKLNEHILYDNLHYFIIGLRIILHHLHMVSGNPIVHKNFQENSIDANFLIEKREFLKVAENSKKRFKSEQLKYFLEHLKLFADHINVRSVFEEYSNRVFRFHNWVQTELLSEAFPDLHDYDRCIKERKKYGVRLSWKAFMGNWLRWENPPNPHNHLHRFLTSEQITKVNEFSRNSREQVDLIIRYMDKDNAIDEELRQMAYELFARSTV